MRTRSVLLLVGGLALLLPCALAVVMRAAYPAEMLFHLLFGWLLFLFRVIPNLTVDPSGLLTAAVCLALLGWGLHLFLRWAYRNRRPASEGETQRPWRIRWTAVCLLGVVLLFTAGIAAVGITHQTGWLLTSPEPLAEGLPDWVARPQSQTNLKWIGMGMHQYAYEHKHFPPGGTFDAEGRGMHGWQTYLLPYVDRIYLHERIDLERPWDDPANVPHFRNVVETYWYPGSPIIRDDEGLALSHYAANVHVLNGGPPLSPAQDFPGGMSSTILAGEVAARHKPWGHPANWRDPTLGINATPEGFGSPSETGANFLFADGSVRSLTNETDPQVLRSLSTSDAD